MKLSVFFYVPNLIGKYSRVGLIPDASERLGRPGAFVHMISPRSNLCDVLHLECFTVTGTIGTHNF